MGIFINETGYLTNANKKANVLKAGEYSVIDKVSGKPVYSGITKAFGMDETSGDECHIFDFSNVVTEGEYYISDGIEKSADFSISDKVYDELLFNLVKCLHYQRCGCELKSEHVGPYKHDKCHADMSIFVEDYINKVGNPTQFDATGGWHDAGDFGKYISPAAVTIGHLLYAYELFQDKMTFDLNIPESGNKIPDLLNEIRYEVDWMFKMQNSEGGLYHKVTTFNHVDFIMPEEDLDQMLIYPVSSIATADFAAAMAIVSRVYRPFDSELADKALEAARKAFKWLENNDYIGFHNPKGSNTGEYDDETDVDERLWAAAEMLRTDSEGDVDAYRAMLNKYAYSDIPKTDFGWTDVAGFSLLSVLTDSKHTAGEEVEAILYSELFKEADRLVDIMNNAGYEIAMETDDFVWGSNMVVTNRGMLLVLAALFMKNHSGLDKYAKNDASTYLAAASNQMNYLLGRNALGRSYVTGFGEHAFRNPHNRTSACDGVDDPMPGWVSGGPFKDFVDAAALKMLPKGCAPQKCHCDVIGSYSTNEITIYWNSSAAFLLAGIISL